jgi:PAS domain S-box-containing protein
MQANILIIEDDPIILENLFDLLSVYGYHPEAFNNAEAAIIRYNEKRFDLVICDHHLGNTTGIDVLKNIRAEKPEMYVPFVMITANEDKILYRTAMNLGADDFILKPFRSVDLIESIERQLEKVNFWRSRLEALANFPHENPNPVLRLENTLFTIQFSNPAFSKKYESMDDEIKTKLHQFLEEKTKIAIEQRTISVHLFETRNKFFNVTFAPQIAKGYTNIYFSDITQLVATENTLRKTESFYKEILDNIPADIAVFDKDKKYLYVNPNGIKDPELREWIVGKTDADYIQIKNITNKEIFKDRHIAFDRAKNTLTDAIWIDEHKTKEGLKKHVLRKFHPVKSETGEASLIIGYGVDITERIQTEKELEKSRTRYKVLFDSNPQMVFIVNAKGLVVDINNAAIAQLGYSEQELLGHSVLEVFPQENHEAVKNTLETCFANPHIQHEWETVKLTKNANRMHVYEVAKCISIKGQKEKLLLIVCTDITEKRNNEILLKETYEMNQMLLAEMPVPVAIVNKGIISQYNKSFHKLFGFNVDELIGKSIIEITKPDHIEILQKKIEERYKTSEKVMSCEVEMVTKQFDTRNIVINGTLFTDKGENYTLAVFNDITEIRQAETRKRAAEILSKTILNSSLDAVIMLNNNGNVIDWNYQAEIIFGYKKEEVLNNHIIDLIAPKQLKLIYKTVMNMFLKTGKGKAINNLVEINTVNKKGEIIPTELFIVVINMNGSNVFTGFLRDITARKESENQLKLLANELGQQNEELRRFAYITSHDLRAPVINLNSLLSHYDTENPASELNIEIINRFKTSSKRIYDTLSDLLEVTRIKDKTAKERQTLVSPLKVFTNCLSDNDQDIKKIDAEVSYEFEGPESILTNASVLNSIFTNLITNAVKYRSPKRKLLINCTTSLVKNEYAIRFQDNGLGMDLTKNKNKLFTLYQRFHDHVEGKGLGLYLVKSQLESLGGNLNIESELDIGTTFIISIPVKDN